MKMNEEVPSYQSEKISNEIPSKDTADDEEFSMDGFNYSPAEAFIQGLAGLVNQSDVENIIRAQKQMFVNRSAKTN